MSEKERIAEILRKFYAAMATARNAKAGQVAEEWAVDALLRSEPVGEPVAWSGYCGDPECDESPVLTHSPLRYADVPCGCGRVLDWHPLYARPSAPTEGGEPEPPRPKYDGTYPPVCGFARCKEVATHIYHARRIRARGRRSCRYYRCERHVMGSAYKVEPVVPPVSAAGEEERDG